MMTHLARATFASTPANKRSSHVGPSASMNDGDRATLQPATSNPTATAHCSPTTKICCSHANTCHHQPTCWQGPRAPSETPRRSDPIRRVFSSSDILLRRAVLPADTSSTPDWQLRLDHGRCGPLTATNLKTNCNKWSCNSRNSNMELNI